MDIAKDSLGIFIAVHQSFFQYSLQLLNHLYEPCGILGAALWFYAQFHESEIYSLCLFERFQDIVSK